MKYFLTAIQVLLLNYCMAQNVGIGLSNPSRSLSVQGSLLIDQEDTNQGTLEPGLLFGANTKVGIASSKSTGSSLRNGLSFYTNNFLRMCIDSNGKVGIGAPAFSDYALTVYGNTYSYSNYVDGNSIVAYNSTVNGNGYILGSLNINTSGINTAALYIKGQSGTPSDWGQHIHMQAAGNSANDDHGNIIYDGNGMKFRVFNADDQYYFRNPDNSNLARIDAAGNFFATGNITTNGRLVVSSNNGYPLNTYVYTSPANLNFVLNANGSLTFNITYTGFSSAPVLTGGVFTSGVTQEGSLFIGYENITTTGCTVRVTNVSASTQVTGTNVVFKTVVIGAAN